MKLSDDFGLRRRAYWSLGAIAALVLGAGAWGGLTDLSGAVIARGQLAVDGNVKKVQHLQGGIVGDIRVANGSRVAAGDVLIRLDDAQLRAQHAIVAAKLAQLAGELARLESERDGAGAIVFPASLDAARASGRDTVARDTVAGETRLFAARRAARAAQQARLDERLVQIDMEIKGLAAQHEAKSRELELIKNDLAAIETLWARHLTTLMRVTTARRERARFEGELASIAAQMARARAQASEVRQQVAENEQRWLGEVQRDLRDAEARRAELEERRVALEDQLARVDLRAPVAGIVHELQQHTIGGVVRPGETAMSIVPLDRPLIVEARVAPSDIDQVRAGQPALLRFAAFSQRTTPEIKGEVVDVGADLTRDNGQSYYIARIRLAGAAPAHLTLVAGMPVEGFIETGRRTAWSYILKPLTDNLARAFREQ
jgi:HlyD family secretion protein